MTTVNPLNNQTQVPTVTTAATSTTANSSVNQNQFLNLLVAELKNQDPSQPADTTAMMSQEAQFSELNAITAMSTSMTTLLNSQQSTQAAGMIGKSISATNPAGGAAISGTVTGVKLGTDGPTLLIGNTEVALSSVTEVDTPTTTTS